MRVVDDGLLFLPRFFLSHVSHLAGLRVAGMRVRIRMRCAKGGILGGEGVVKCCVVGGSGRQERLQFAVRAMHRDVRRVSSSSTSLALCLLAMRVLFRSMRLLFASLPVHREGWSLQYMCM